MTTQPPVSDPLQPQPPRPPRRVGRHALALLTVLAGGASILLLISLTKPVASAIDRVGGTRLTLTARPPDGSQPASETLSQAQSVIRKRVIGLGVGEAQINAAGDTLTVTMPGQHQSGTANLGQVGRLNIRPVVNSLAANQQPMTGPSPAGAAVGALNGRGLAEQIALEKQWRQSISRGIQFLALQFEATRCDKPDALADNDDPDLPLVTCSADHKSVYLLGPAIISGDHIHAARAEYDRATGRYGIDLQFDNPAESTWTQFATGHSGQQVAYTVDTRVVSAPRSGPAAHDGTARIDSDPTAFTSESAHDLANTLNSGPLPVAFEVSTPQAVAPKPGAAGLWHSRAPVGLVITAIGLVIILLSLQVYFYRSGRQRLSAHRPM